MLCPRYLRSRSPRLESQRALGILTGSAGDWPTLAKLENLRMSESQNEFTGIRRFLWLAVGFILMAAILGSAVYIIAHVLKCL